MVKIGPVRSLGGIARRLIPGGRVLSNFVYLALLANRYRLISADWVGSVQNLTGFSMVLISLRKNEVCRT